ncbi:MAG: class I SAM-dependent methyltransferase [bacterium]|nr:class I SAM-dependent methyltransferase [bacterium]
MSIIENTPDLNAIKNKQQVTWATGCYPRIGSLIQVTGERLVEGMDARPGARFLDVAAGNGNLSLAAARRFCDVVSTDYVPESLEYGRSRAEANAFPMDFRTADAENLPFEDGEFECVGSTFGVMFTADQERAAAELLRLCAPGGKIGMANWTPDGFIGRLFRTIGRLVPPPAAVQSPARWGTEAFLEAQFGPAADSVEVRRRDYIFRYLSAEHFLAFFKEHYGPTIKALEALGERAPELEAAILELLNECNTATDGTLCVPSEYFEVVVTKKS